MKVFGWIQLGWSSENINFECFFSSSIVLKIRLQVTNNSSCKVEEVTCCFFSFTIRLHLMADLIDMPRLFKVAHTTYITVRLLQINKRLSWIFLVTKWKIRIY